MDLLELKERAKIKLALREKLNKTNTQMILNCPLIILPLPEDPDYGSHINTVIKTDAVLSEQVLQLPDKPKAMASMRKASSTHYMCSIITTCSLGNEML